MAARSKAWFCGRSIAGIAGSNPTGGQGCLSALSVVCCQAEVTVKGRSLVQGVSQCDGEASIMRMPGPVGAVAHEGALEDIFLCLLRLPAVTDSTTPPMLLLIPSSITEVT